MILKPLILAYGVVGLAALLLVAYLVGRCQAPDPPDRADLPPEVIPEEEVIDFEPDVEPGIIERIMYRDAPVVRRGEAPADPARFAAYVDALLAARDSAQADTVTPRFPPMRVDVDDPELKIGLTRSDGVYVVEQWNCPQPCSAGAEDSVLYARSRRKLPGFASLKTALVCGGFGLASYGVAELVKYEQPIIVGAGAAGACVVARVVF